jgi:hypothetical protein
MQINNKLNQTAMSKYDNWSNIELAEAIVDTIEGFENHNPQDIAVSWDRCDMIDELVNEYGDGLD